jgi:seryl-tRNA synthetase
VTRPARYSADELRDQWAFLDALVERQASSLRAGVQDPEEDEPLINAVAAADAALLRELDVLRVRVGEIDGLRERIDSLRKRVRALEAERRELLQRLRETPAVPAAADHHDNRSIRKWWRRVSR